jgi:hypothetical protein
MRNNRLLGEIADLYGQAEHNMGLSMDEFDLTPLEVLVDSLVDITARIVGPHGAGRSPNSSKVTE